MADPMHIESLFYLQIDFLKEKFFFCLSFISSINLRSYLLLICFSFVYGIVSCKKHVK